MPLKKRHGKGMRVESEKKALEPPGVVLMCNFKTPGPKYKLKTLFGYKNHCISKYRNPAYTFGGRRIAFREVESPGPKYKIKEPKILKGFSFGLATKYRDIVFGPGPKYKLPGLPRSPFFSMKWRTKLRKTDVTPGPYYIKSRIDAPAFSMGLRTADEKPEFTVGPYSYNVNALKPKAPMYIFAGRQAIPLLTTGPGPKYAIRPSKPTPAFSFGVKHSRCAPPYITECDRLC